MKPEEKNHKTEQNAPTPGEYRAVQGSAEANEQDHLQWLAFCYVADELTASQRADFESRLSTDLRAQEALASVVELSCGVHKNYQLQTESANTSTLLERAGTRDSTSDQPSTLSRLLLMAAAVLVMAAIGYGLVQNSNQSTVANHSHQQSSDSDFSADDWINSLDEIDGDQIELVDNEENASLVDVSEDENLNVDSVLISFYSEVFDGQQEEPLLNPKSLNRDSGMDL